VVGQIVDRASLYRAKHNTGDPRRSASVFAARLAPPDANRHPYACPAPIDLLRVVAELDRRRRRAAGRFPIIGQGACGERERGDERKQRAAYDSA
jgi:hypothetical protein